MEDESPQSRPPKNAPAQKTMLKTSLFSSPLQIFSAAILLRLVLFFYGLWQDANTPIRYTDIDYFVFTDSSRYLSHSSSPYSRSTYRYTPLLAYLLLPTTWNPQWLWFSFGKCLFALSDIITGYLIFRILISEYKMGKTKALKYASIWLLNPMVATISTRGSSEGLLAVMTVGLLYAVIRRKVFVAGVLLGLGVHFKIYPFIYATSIVWWMDDENLGKMESKDMGSLNIMDMVRGFLNRERVTLAVVSLMTFLGLNLWMYLLYVSSSKTYRDLLLMWFKVWVSVSPTYISPPYHTNRPPPQLLPLQHPPLPQLLQPLPIIPPRIPSFHSTTPTFSNFNPLTPS